MVAHLKPAEESSELRFSEATVASLWFRWEGKKSMAQISLWQSGDCDVEIAETASGAFHPFRHLRCKTKEEFYQMLRGMIATVSQLEEIADPAATDNSGASPLRV
jgi:hypothetical protein